MPRAGFYGSGSAVPTRRVDNVEIAGWKNCKYTPDGIRDRTGIEARYIAAPEETTSDYATWAAERALKDAGLSASDIDLILLATSTSDYPVPATAPLVQNRLRAKCGAYDIGAGCAGFVTALSAANAYVVSEMYQRVLVIGADLLSRITPYDQPKTYTLLADGAGAVVVGPVGGDYGMDSFFMESHGDLAKTLYIPAGGSAEELTPQGLAEGRNKLQMDGKAVYTWAKGAMPNVVRRVAEKAGLSADDFKEKIDLFLPHQANLRIIKEVADELGLSVDDDFVVNIYEHGNTSAASIPLAYDQGVKSGEILDGMVLILDAFGSGLLEAGCRLKVGRGLGVC